MTTTFNAGWYADPAGIHELRFWSGTEWTNHVCDAGVVTTQLPAAPAGLTKAEVAHEVQRRVALNTAHIVGFQSTWRSRRAPVIAGVARARQLPGYVLAVAGGMRLMGAGTSSVVVLTTDSLFVFSRDDLYNVEVPGPMLEVPWSDVYTIKGGSNLTLESRKIGVVRIASRFSDGDVLASVGRKQMLEHVLERDFVPEDRRMRGMDATFIGSTSSELNWHEGEALQVWAHPEGLTFADPHTSSERTIGFDRMAGVQIGERTRTSGGGFSGGGFGLAGFAAGVVAAGVLNGLSTRTDAITLLRIKTHDGRIDLIVPEFTANELGLVMSSAIERMTAHRSMSDADTH